MDYYYYTFEIQIKGFNISRNTAEQQKRIVVHARVDVDGYNINDAKKKARICFDEYVNEWFYPARYKFVYHRKWLKDEGVPKKLGKIYK